MSEVPGATAEEIAADCPYINEYCRTRHRGVVSCSWGREKGRILLSCRKFKQGDVIFREPPLHIVAEQKGNPVFDRLKDLCSSNRKVYEYELLWYWTALCSLTGAQLPVGGASQLQPISEDQQRKLLLLYHSDVTKPSEASKALVQEFGLSSTLEPLQLERCLQVWILNCFEHSDDPLGYSTYFMSSFMSHSCLPNAVWHYEGDDFVLRARCDIAEDSEITVSYLSEETLMEAVPSRRKHLKDSKHFICACDRCNGLQDFSRGFRCPQCSAPVFPRPRVEASTGAAGLPGAHCERRECRRPVAASEATTLLSEERWVEVKIEGYERSMEKDARSRHTALLAPLEEVAERAEKSLSQHWLLDKTWGLLVDVYERNARTKDAEALLQKRIAFQEAAYPELSGIRAWTLEGYADMLLRHSRTPVDPHVKVPSQQAAQNLSQTAVPIYAQSLRMLGLLFGDQHEYYTSVQRKALELAAELRRHLGEQGAPASASASAAPAAAAPPARAGR